MSHPSMPLLNGHVIKFIRATPSDAARFDRYLETVSIADRVALFRTAELPDAASLLSTGLAILAVGGSGEVRGAAWSDRAHAASAPIKVSVAPNFRTLTVATRLVQALT